MNNIETLGYLVLFALAVGLAYIAIKMLHELKNPYRDETDHY